jgi:plastocyanin
MVKILLGVLLLLPAAAGEETFTVSGTVKLPGEVPRARPNKRLEGDPPCCALHKETPPLDNLVVDPSGGVCWAFVYVKKGLEGKSFEPSATPVLIDQKGCQYHPHVAGAMVGQTVNFRNSDKMLHNVHGIPFTNKEFNFGQTEGAVSGVKFTQAEVPAKVVCNVHTWMASFVCVVDHPYFAVTDVAGKFEIKGLPAGTYTLGVWHEGLKTLDGKNEIDIVVKANAAVEFVMK